jgi:murein DD-endopeptidase MepM/ murein hydrolase activator NlpD
VKVSEVDVICISCGRTLLDESERVILARGRVREAHCSQICLRETIENRRQARAVASRRWRLRFALVALPLATAAAIRNRYHAPRPEVIVAESPPPLPEPAAPEPIRFGPAWPPTKADWNEAFNRSRWVFPLPGPVRRPSRVGGHRFGPAPSPPGHGAQCEDAGRCEVELGGELWGEHVYAVHDGVVDRIQGQSGNEAGEDPGGLHVRLAHFGGMVFTQYFHLAAIPRTITRGARVKAGDLVGLVGDTGTEGAPRHLAFTLSIRPSSAFPEIYRDPTEWIGQWPLRLEPHGSVAGLAPTHEEPGSGRRGRPR